MVLKGFLKKFLARRKTPDRIEYLSFEEMERLLNSTVIPLFKNYRSELLEKPPEYIALAVWGEDKSCSLDATQKEIHRALAPLCEKILHEIVEHKSDDISGLYIKYLLNGLLLYKISYMTQYYKNVKNSRISN